MNGLYKLFVLFLELVLVSESVKMASLLLEELGERRELPPYKSTKLYMKRRRITKGARAEHYN